MNKLKTIVDMFLQALSVVLENQSSAELVVTMGDDSKVKVTIEFIEEGVE
jgi:hypothetical protein